MRFRVLACDYDATLATHGVASDAAVGALRSVAASGRRLVLVTGRVMEELLDAFSEIDVFDRVVAENGGMLYDPATGGHRLLGPPVPADLVAELRAADVTPLVVGRVICSTNEAILPRVRAALHRLGIERELILNKGSLMVLPAGVDKASGLQAAVADLAETMQATVAVGDAENDVVLLEASGVGVAVANALDELKQRADVVLARSNGEGVRQLCQSLLDDDLAALLEPAASPTV